MKLLGLFIVGISGKLWGCVGSETDQFPVVSDNGLKFTMVGIYALWKRSLRAIPLSVSRVVSDVFRMRADSEIGKSIVQRIAVSVIHNHTGGYSHSTKSQHDSMGGGFVEFSRNAKHHMFTHWPLSGSLKFIAARFKSSVLGIPCCESPKGGEVRAGPYFPRQLSDFGIIVKTLAENFRRWQDSCRSHSGNFSLGFRWIGEPNTSQSAAILA